MDSYPHVPGSWGTDTSIAAAEFMAGIQAPVQRAVLRAIRDASVRGLTAHELAVALGLERTTVQPRTSELRALGKIRDSGQRRPNPNGKMAIVWVAVGGTV
jgi:predicted 2-oxoglutarate/Fe(II)-dependent dioxygenase YbiX